MNAIVPAGLGAVILYAGVPLVALIVAGMGNIDSGLLGRVTIRPR